MSRARRMLRKAGLLLAGVLGALLIGEGLLRLLRDENPLVADLGRMNMAPGPDAELSLLWKPDCADCLPRTNSLGFPGPEPGRRDPTVREVVLLGDSMCQGPGLPWEQTLPAQLEQRLNAGAQAAPATTGPSPEPAAPATTGPPPEPGAPATTGPSPEPTAPPDTVEDPAMPRPPSRPTRVLSLCIGGHGLVESLAALKRYALPRQPDLVLHVLFINDASRLLFLDANTPGSPHRPAALAPLVGRQAPFRWIPASARAWLTHHSYLYAEAGIRLSLLLADQGATAIEDCNLSDAELAALLGERAAACREAGVRCAFVLMPRATHDRCRPGPDGATPEATPPCEPDRVQLDQLARGIEGLGEPVLDLRPRFLDPPFPLGHADRPHDLDHLGPQGHAYVAGVMAEFVDRLLEN